MPGIEMMGFLFAGALLAGFAMGLVGFGTGLLALGLWLQVITPVVAVPLIAICSLATTLFTLPTFWHALSFSRIAPFLFAGLVSLPLGVLLLSRLEPTLFKLAIGVFLIFYALFRLVLLPNLVLEVRNRGWDMAVGSVSGFLAGLSATPGPITTIWTGLRGWSKDEQRAVYQPFHQILLIIALAGYGLDGLLTWELAKITAVCLPGTFAGMALGIFAYKRLDDQQFTRVLLWLLLASGVALIVNSI